MLQTHLSLGSRQLLSVLLCLILLATATAPAFAAEAIQVQIQNKTGAKVTLSLSGPASYTFSLGTGKNSVQVVPGKYTFSYQACDQTLSGKFNAKKAGDSLTLPKCSSGGGGKSGGGMVTIRVKNTTGGTVSLYLSGPQSYSFSLPPGTSTITIAKGKYNIDYYQCGGMHYTGSFNFKANQYTWNFKCE